MIRVRAPDRHAAPGGGPRPAPGRGPFRIRPAGRTSPAPPQGGAPRPRPGGLHRPPSRRRCSPAVARPRAGRLLLPPRRRRGREERQEPRKGTGRRRPGRGRRRGSPSRTRSTRPAAGTPRTVTGWPSRLRLQATRHPVVGAEPVAGTARRPSVRRRFGIEVVTQAVLGHSELGVTQVYAERDDDLGPRGMREVG